MFLLETIKVKERQLQNTFWHNQRLNATRQALFQSTEKWDLSKLIQLPTDLNNGTYKCRVTYGTTIQNIEFETYQPKRIQTLRTAINNEIDYQYKYADRQKLKKLYSLKGNCDDILIIKNGCVTDTSYCNIAFFDGQKWWTSDTPLLNGTHRQMLLHQKIIHEKRIEMRDIYEFQAFKLFNAMMNWEEQEAFSVLHIQ